MLRRNGGQSHTGSFLDVYLLDTNHCSRYVFGDVTVVRQLDQIDIRMLATSIIVHGELCFMVERSKLKEQNHQAIRIFLDKIAWHGIDKNTSEVYGRLKARLIEYFGPKEGAARRKITVQQLGFHDNDLWIAATAIRYDLTLLSTDSDFKRIAQAANLRIENWCLPG